MGDDTIVEDLEVQGNIYADNDKDHNPRARALGDLFRHLEKTYELDRSDAQILERRGRKIDPDGTTLETMNMKLLAATLISMGVTNVVNKTVVAELLPTLYPPESMRKKTGGIGIDTLTDLRLKVSFQRYANAILEAEANIGVDVDDPTTPEGLEIYELEGELNEEELEADDSDNEDNFDEDYETDEILD